VSNAFKDDFVMAHVPPRRSRSSSLLLRFKIFF
jgi:hypothetical protein